MSVGVADLSLEPALLNLEFESFTVFGPRRSGRSTALSTIAHQLAANRHEVWAIGQPGSPLLALDSEVRTPTDLSNETVKTFLEELAETHSAYQTIDRFLIIDDLDRFDDPSYNASFKKVADAGVRFIGSAISARSLGIGNPVTKQLKSPTAALLLKGEDEATLTNLIGTRFRVRPGLEMVPGRGILLTNGSGTIVQTATTI